MATLHIGRPWFGRDRPKSSRDGLVLARNMTNAGPPMQDNFEAITIPFDSGCVTCTTKAAASP